MEQGLLDRIASGEQRKPPTLKLDGEAVARAVAGHLRKVLNTRVGSAPAAPDFGLPDFNDIMFQFPDGLRQIAAAIRDSIERYEPRLRRAQVRHLPGNADPFRLRFSISAELRLGDRYGRVSFETSVDGAGHVRVWE